MSPFLFFPFPFGFGPPTCQQTSLNFQMCISSSSNFIDGSSRLREPEWTRTVNTYLLPKHSGFEIWREVSLPSSIHLTQSQSYAYPLLAEVPFILFNILWSAAKASCILTLILSASVHFSLFDSLLGSPACVGDWPGPLLSLLGRGTLAHIVHRLRLFPRRFIQFGPSFGESTPENFETLLDFPS